MGNFAQEREYYFFKKLFDSKISLEEITNFMDSERGKEIYYHASCLAFHMFVEGYKEALKDGS